MDVEMIILLAAIAVGLGLACYKAYKKLMLKIYLRYPLLRK